MLRGVRLRGSLTFGMCIIALTAVLFPRAASAAPLDVFTQFSFDARSLLIAGIVAGSMLFATFAGGIFLRSTKRARRAERRARESTEKLDNERASMHALIAAEPQLLMRWDGDGAPELAAATLDATLGIPSQAGDVARFSSWLEPNSAGDLEARMNGLLKSGEGFALRIETSTGARLGAIGRATSSGAVLKLRDMTGELDEMAALSDENARLGRDMTMQRSLFDALPMPVWFRDSEGRLEWVNAAYARAVDAASSQQVCEQQIEFLSTHQRNAAEQNLSQDETHAKRIHAVVSGKRRAFDIIALPAGSASAGIAIDAAALETAQSALSRHIEEHTRTLDRITTAVAIFSPDQQLQYYNRAFTDLWELDDSWLAEGPSDGEVLDALRQRSCLPEQADYREWKQQQLGRHEIASSHEDRWHLPDGRTIHVVANHASDGGATYLYENITEQLALKSRYNALIHVQEETLDHMREGVAVFTPGGRLKLYNPVFANIWQLDTDALDAEPHIDEVIGWCSALLDEDAGWDEIKRAITSIDDQRETLEGQVSRPDGNILAFACLPLPDGATLLTYLDITDSKRVENALIERNEALMAADQLKSAFISHVSYELRTPLTSIIGFAELLSNPVTGELNLRQSEYLDDIRSSSGSLLTIINDILDLATIDAGALELSLGRVRAREVIDAAVVGVSERLKLGGLKLRINIADDAEDFVADGRRMTQVLFNLLSNAIGFSESGGRIAIDCRREDNIIAISVADTGRGIPEDYQENAFDRFESRSLGSSHRGAGLGLTIVKKLVELHGGTVVLNSAPGVGTTVTVRLPAARASAAPSSDRDRDDADGQSAPPAAATG